MYLNHLYFDIVSDLGIRISNLWRTFSTQVENVRQIHLFMQNKPNFPHFSPENEDYAKKQTQFKAKQSQFWADFKGSKAKTNPIKPKKCTLLRGKGAL